MKRTLLSGLTLLAFSCTMYAQPILTAATNNPVAGDVYYGHYADTAGVSAGASGTAATWNFSALTTIDLDTTTYMTCMSTPYCDSFPGSNIVFYDNTDYVYGVANTSGLSFNGVYSMGMYMHLTGAKHLMFYPFTYGSTHSNTYSIDFPGFGSYSTTYDSSTVDGWGTLITPTGTYANALREHVISITKDSLDMGSSSMVSYTRSESFNWFVSGFRSPLVTITVDTAAGMPYVSDVKYFRTAVTTAVGNMPTSVSMQVYPNPASDVVNINVDISNAASDFVTMTDVTGRVVHVVKGNDLKKGRNNLSVPVSNFPGGLYIVQLHTSAGVITQKVVIAQ